MGGNISVIRLCTCVCMCNGLCNYHNCVQLWDEVGKGLLNYRWPPILSYTYGFISSFCWRSRAHTIYSPWLPHILYHSRWIRPLTVVTWEASSSRPRLGLPLHTLPPHLKKSSSTFQQECQSLMI